MGDTHTDPHANPNPDPRLWEVSCVARLSAQCVVSGSFDTTLHVWEVASLKSAKRSHAGQSEEGCLRAMRDGRIVRP